MGKHDGRIPLGRPRRRWKDNIKMDLTEVGWWHELDHLVQDREMWRNLVNEIINPRVP